ncbi:hypothetical protein NQ315_016322 [Exocentrus adspersus]|uniref:C2H2-type domain-containing protein n=1 Tax=Exocentrus adspersus TaxID=1586481 RepID=A0AAV8VPI8_9CUCU|nr:hypothetical protein NQ315_016322 [Exocentrus adspersus]
MCSENHRWHYDYVRLAWDTGFSFDKYKHPTLDKNKICLVDIERIIKERDVASIERFLPTVIQFALDNDQAELLDTNFVKMFRMSQLSVEYLLFCKRYLDNTVVLLKKDVSKLKEENKELKLFTEELEEHVSALTKQSLVTTFKCGKCPKVFSSEEYLISHAKRRHSLNNDTKISTNTDTDQLQSEIKQLKERLNITEKLLQEKEKKERDIRDIVKESDENKVRAEEILEKFEKFRDKVENDLKMLQVEKNFYEEKYSRLFDIVFELNKKDNANVEVEKQQQQLPKKSQILREIAVETITENKVESTTQTEKENIPSRRIQLERAVHNKNFYEFKDVDVDLENKAEDTFEQKISQFEEQMELKISSGLSNIEKQMQAFWGKLSEIEIKREANTLGDNQENPPSYNANPTKPKIKPRMKFSQPSKVVSDNEENAKKIKAELEKMCGKPEIIQAAAVKTEPTEPGNRMVAIPDMVYNSSTESESKSDSESESITDLSKINETKPSISTLGKRSVTSLKKAAQSQQVTEKLYKEITNVINNRLQDIGISPNWKGVPQKTFEKAMKIVQHQAELVKKSYPEYNSLKRSIQKSLNRKLDSIPKPAKTVVGNTNVISISYRKKLNNVHSEPESRPSPVVIRNRSLYNTESDSDNLESLSKPPTKVSEVVPAYSVAVQELKIMAHTNIDTDSDVNSVILPNEEAEASNENVYTKSALKNYPSVGCLTKKKVLFDIDSEKTAIRTDVNRGVKGISVSSIESGDAIDEKKHKKVMVVYQISI